jgi:hypothetical protein
MKNFFLIQLFIIFSFSCSTYILKSPNQISLKEADRILLEAMYKTEMLASYDNTIIFLKDFELDKNKIIYFDSTKIKKLDLSFFPNVRKIERIKLLNANEIKQGDEEKGYWIISFRRNKDSTFNINISTDFYIPKGMPLEMDGFNYWFNYRIVKGKAELIRWRGV